MATLKECVSAIMGVPRYCVYGITAPSAINIWSTHAINCMPLIYQYHVKARVSVGVLLFGQAFSD